MSVVEVLVLVVAVAAGAGASWMAAEWSCRRRWRRAATSGSLPLRGRHGRPSRGQSGGGHR